MTASDQVRIEVLLENIQSSVHEIAKGCIALTERFDRFEARLDRLERRLEQVANQVTAIDAKVTVIDAKLDTFSVNTQSRLKRIEAHLGLPMARGPRKPH